MNTDDRMIIDPITMRPISVAAHAETWRRIEQSLIDLCAIKHRRVMEARAKQSAPGGHPQTEQHP